MEIINIEARTFEAMMNRFELFTQRVDKLCKQHGGKKELGSWLDNQDVCVILNICKRTLQTLRDNGTLAYSRINGKMYYKPADVERVIKDMTEKEARNE